MSVNYPSETAVHQLRLVDLLLAFVGLVLWRVERNIENAQQDAASRIKITDASREFMAAKLEEDLLYALQHDTTSETGRQLVLPSGITVERAVDWFEQRPDSERAFERVVYPR